MASKSYEREVRAARRRLAKRPVGPEELQAISQRHAAARVTDSLRTAEQGGAIPTTHVLIARHAAETTAFDREFHDQHEWAAHSRRQAAELINHTFAIERQRDEAVACLRELSGTLSCFGDPRSEIDRALIKGRQFLATLE